MALLVWLGLRRANPFEPPTVLDRFLDSPLRWLVQRLYHLVLWLRGAPFRPPPDRPAVRVVCISDTHDQTPAGIPGGDLLIHCGDMTNAGTVADIQAQLDWLASLPHRHKVVVCGNHDSYFDPKTRKPEDRKEGPKEEGAAPELDFHGMHYLQHDEITLDFAGGRKLRVYGAPDIPQCGGSDFAFQYPRHLPPWKNTIPLGIDILVTHTPPRYHLDLGLGCAGLLEEVWRVRPRLHVFGHVHWGSGREPVYFDACQRAYESLMSRGNKGPAAGGERFPMLAGWLDAARVLLHGANETLFKWLMLGPGPNNACLMVNAALMYGNTGRIGRKAQVVVM